MKLKLKKFDGKLPKKLYHVSNPFYRNDIKKEGLLPMVGDSYKCHYEGTGITPIPAIFLGIKNDYDSTYDDDRYEVDTDYIDVNSLYYDPAYDTKYRYLIYFKPIPKEALKLIYRGTGE